MSPIISKLAARELLRILEGPHAPMPREPYIIDELRRALKTKKSVTFARKAKKVKRETRRDEWSQIRAKVLGRAQGHCEACGAQDIRDGSCDHFLGGVGRRVSLQSVFTVWFLCLTCHRQKTDNKPTAAYWLGRFIEHARAAGLAAHSLGTRAEMNGYMHAMQIAEARLDSLTIQGRAVAP